MKSPVWISSGITLIELMLSLFIASMLTMLLYQTLNQSRKMVEQSEMLLHAAAALPRAYNQLEKDITGIFVPHRFFNERAEKKDEKEKQTKEKKESISSLFVGTENDSSLSMLTFFTTHSLALFGSIIPHAVRVVYRVVPTENKLFILERQESSDLDLPLSAYDKNKIQAYALLHNIKHISCEYYATDNSNVDEKSEKKLAQELKDNSWSSDDQGDGDPLIPAFVRISGTIIDERLRREHNFEWFFEIFAYEGVIEQLKLTNNKPEKDNEKKEDKKSVKEEKKDAKESDKKPPNKLPILPPNKPGARA